MMAAVSAIVGKLVRDRIPEIMRAEGKSPEIERIGGERLRSALKDKLVEEAVELRESADITEELADVLEVADALAEAYGLSKEEIMAARSKKRLERGGFREGLFLKS